MSPPRFLTAAPHVRAVAFADATLVLDLRTGALQALTGDTARVWTALAATSDTRTLVPAITPAAVDCAARALIGRGLLIGAVAPRPWPLPASGQESRPSWGTRDSPAAITPIPSPALAWHLPALLAVLTVLVLRHAGPRQGRFARLRRLAARPLQTQRRVDPETATAIVRAVRRVGRIIPARVACLEESAAVMLILCLAGYGAQWKHGVATDPVRLHAWIEVDGHAIDEPADLADYTPFQEQT